MTLLILMTTLAYSAQNVTISLDRKLYGRTTAYTSSHGNGVSVSLSVKCYEWENPEKILNWHNGSGGYGNASISFTTPDKHFCHYAKSKHECPAKNFIAYLED